MKSIVALGQVLAGAGSGVLCGLAFPLVGWHVLAWVGLVPLLLATRSAPARRLPWLALAHATALWAVVWDWGPAAIVHYFDQPFSTGLLVFIALVLITLLPPVLLALLAYRKLAESYSVALPVLTGAAWAATELLRSSLYSWPFPFGNPWATLGLSQVGVDEVGQLASVVGGFGLSFLVVTVNAALVEGIVAARSPRGLRSAAGALLSALALVAATLLHGRVTLRGAGLEDGAEGVRVGFVQPNPDPVDHWSTGRYGQNLSAYLQQTVELAKRQPIDLVLWPESAMAFFLEEEPGYQRAIASHLSPFDLQLVAGAPRRDGANTWNSMYLIQPDGELGARYDKRLLIPFAEYVPLSGLDLVRRRFAIREFEPGLPRPPFPTRAGAAGLLVCNESMFHELAAERVREGAEILINASHDGWIPAAEYAEQQLQLSRLRAIEQRRYLLRISTSGPSAIVDPWGRLLARSEPFSEASLVGTVHPRRDRTLYARIGESFTIGGGFATLLALAVARRKLRNGPD